MGDETPMTENGGPYRAIDDKDVQVADLIQMLKEERAAKATAISERDAARAHRTSRRVARHAGWIVAFLALLSVNLWAYGKYAHDLAVAERHASLVDRDLSVCRHDSARVQVELEYARDAVQACSDAMDRAQSDAAALDRCTEVVSECECLCPTFDDRGIRRVAVDEVFEELSEHGTLTSSQRELEELQRAVLAIDRGLR